MCFNWYSNVAIKAAAEISNKPRVRIINHLLLFDFFYFRNSVRFDDILKISFILFAYLHGHCCRISSKTHLQATTGFINVLNADTIKQFSKGHWKHTLTFQMLPAFTLLINYPEIKCLFQEHLFTNRCFLEVKPFRLKNLKYNIQFVLCDLQNCNLTNLKVFIIVLI